MVIIIYILVIAKWDETVSTRYIIGTKKETNDRMSFLFHSTKNTNHVVSLLFSAVSRTFKPYHRRSLTGMSPSPRVIQRNTRKQRSTMVGDHDPSSSFVTDMEQKLP